MHKPSLTISVAPKKDHLADTISRDNISIGPHGLVVDGKEVSALAKSYTEFTDTNELLGSGISGMVRKIYHQKTGKAYAVKIMTLENGDEFLCKKLVELKTLHASRHANIVDFYGAFYLHGSLYFILEFMDFGTIGDLIKKVGAVNEDALGRIAGGILSGLQYLHHTLHLIHRDIKPQNILLNRQGEVKLTDFGVSGEIANTAAFAKTFVGTVKYMSPSRIKGSPHNAKSDIWSFGLVILECALGRYPYGDDVISNYFHFLQMVVTVPAPIPEAGVFSDAFTAFIALCLEKEEGKQVDSNVLVEHPWIKSHTKFDIKEWFASI
jgi:mitogen-activated protein kinase kinase 1